MIFWIERAFKDEYLNSANNDGLRCKYPINFDAQTKIGVSGFIRFIQKNTISQLDYVWNFSIKLTLLTR